jgi:hypothetical protein
MPRFLIPLVLAFLLLSAGPCLASEFGTREEAVAVKQVQEKFKNDGTEATFRAVTDKTTPWFVAGRGAATVHSCSRLLIKIV